MTAARLLAAVAASSTTTLAPTPKSESVSRNLMDRFIDSIEWIAAIFVGDRRCSTCFVSVLLRYFFSISIPDAYDFGRLLLGILIFWGIARDQLSRHPHHGRPALGECQPAMATRRSTSSPRSSCLFVVAVQSWTLFDKVSTRADNVLTFDLRIPIWPFFAIAWLGDVSAVLLIAVRTYRLIFHPELIGAARSRVAAGRMRRAR